MDSNVKFYRTVTDRSINFFVVLCFFFSFLVYSAISSANIIVPDPDFGDDDSSIFFSTADDVYFLEAFDALPSIGVEASFGFYMRGDITKKVTVFDNFDQAIGAPDQTAYASFSDVGGNFVFDLDEGVLQDTFTAGFDEIGFFLDLEGFYTVYSDPLDNGGFDLMETFPSLTDSSIYYVGAEIPDGSGGLATVYLALVSGISPASIPEPSTPLLMLSGLLFLLAKKRNFIKIEAYPI